MTGSPSNRRAVRRRSPRWWWAAMLCLLPLVGCSPNSPLGVAEEVREAFAEGRMDDIYDWLTPEAQNRIELARRGTIQRYEDADKTHREMMLKEMNQEMWWNKRWDTLKTADDLKEITAEQLFGYDYTKHYATTKNFNERAEALLRTDYDRSFTANEEYGGARVAYANHFGDGLTVSLTERDGDWRVSDVDVRGFPLRTNEQMQEKE